jgi:hypothetical protein
MRRLAAILASVLVPAASALAQAPPAPPPAICAGDAWTDLVGTDAADTLTAPDHAARVWGLGGDDRLTGSATRAACLLGGDGNDMLALDRGGGVAYGNAGSDTIRGSDLGDLIYPGHGLDGVTAGGGDDKIDVRDGEPEVVDCGSGADIVKADRRDVLIGCESVDVAGPPAPRLSPYPAQTPRHGMVRVRMVVPRAEGEGAYRMIYVTDCGRGAQEITRFPEPGRSVRRGQHVKLGLRPPAGGWCRQTARIAVIRYGDPALPPAGVARFSFAVR